MDTDVLVSSPKVPNPPPPSWTSITSFFIFTSVTTDPRRRGSRAVWLQPIAVPLIIDRARASAWTSTPSDVPGMSILSVTRRPSNAERNASSFWARGRGTDRESMPPSTPQPWHAWTSPFTVVYRPEMAIPPLRLPCRLHPLRYDGRHEPERIPRRRRERSACLPLRELARDR